MFFFTYITAAPNLFFFSFRHVYLVEVSCDNIKEAIIPRMVGSEQKRLQNLLSTEEHDDYRSSQVLRHLQHRLGNKGSLLNTATLRELFLHRLPSVIRICLAPSRSIPLLELAELPDKNVEVAAQVVVNAS